MNARCVSEFHSGNCQCNPGYFGDPYSYCETGNALLSTNNLFALMFHLNLIEKIEPPPIATGCASNNDCPDYTACENRKCINPCAERDPCARNAYCKVIRHKPVCTCPDGYIGDPTTSCELRKYIYLVSDQAPTMFIVIAFQNDIIFWVKFVFGVQISLSYMVMNLHVKNLNCMCEYWEIL